MQSLLFCDLQVSYSQCCFWQVLRAADPALIHVYHDKFCDPALPSDQTRMCLATAAEGLGFKQVLGRLVLATHGFNITSIV